MHNLGVVLAFESLRTVKKKSFWVSTLAFPALLAAIFLVMGFSTRTAGQAADQAAKERFSMMVLDESKLVSPAALAAVGATAPASREAGIAAVREGRVDAFIAYPADPSRNPTEIHAQDVGLIKNGKYATVARQLLQASVAASIGSAEKVALVKDDPPTRVTTYQEGEVSKGLERAIPPGVFLLLFYVIIVLLGGQMLTSTTEEKENRVIEMVLTTVTSRALIVGKILAMSLVGLVQIAAILTPIVVAYVFFRDSLNIPAIDLTQLVFDPVRIAIGAVLFVGAFLLFTGLLVGIGAAVPTAKEANSFFGVAIFAMIAPMYAVGAVVTDPSQTLVKIFTFFPLSAPVTLMLRNAIGNLAPWETAVGVTILIVSGVLAVSVAVRVFRYGTLEYSRKLSLREIFGRRAA